MGAGVADSGCAFCVGGVPPRWLVVGADGREYRACRPCVREAERFGIAQSAWKSYRRLSATPEGEQ